MNTNGDFLPHRICLPFDSLCDGFAQYWDTYFQSSEHVPSIKAMAEVEHIVWIGYLGEQTVDYVIGLMCTILALFGCYTNISFMCPLFRHRNEHLRIPSVRFIFHISLADLLYGAFTAVFLILNMVYGLTHKAQYFIFFVLAYLTFVVEFFITLVSMEHFSEVCNADYDRDIRIRDCKRQPMVIWLLPVILIVGTILTPYDPYTYVWWYVFPSIVVLVFLVTFLSTFIYIFVVRRMNLDLHHQGIMDDGRARLRQRNRVICVHLAMTVVFLGLASAGVLIQSAGAYLVQSPSRGWSLAAGFLGLANAIVKPIVYVVGTPFYRDVFLRKDYIDTLDERDEQEA